MELFISILPFLLIQSDDYCTQYLDHLLEMHREFGLPLPPREASLVRYVPEPSTYFQMGKKVIDPGDPGLGFSLDGRTVLGLFNDPRPVVSLQAVKPDLTTIDTEHFILLPSGIWNFAVACHERGWEPLARAAIRRLIPHYGWITVEDQANSAWYWWQYQLQEPSTPLTLIARNLRIILPHADREVEFKRGLLHSIELAIKPTNSLPGSDEALIDALIEVPGKVHVFHSFDIANHLDDPRLQAIVRRGLAIVPALIAHLDDERITRLGSYDTGFQNRDDMRVKDVAMHILNALASGPFWVPEDTLPARVEAVTKWLAKASKLGEEEYIVGNLFGREEYPEELNPALFWLLREKYPRNLPVVYREMIDNRPHESTLSWLFARAVAEAPIEEAEKEKVFRYAAIQKNPNYRYAGIKYLRLFNPKQAKGLLLAALERLPDRVEKRECLIAYVVATNSEKEEWDALARALKRVELGSRLELLSMVGTRREPGVGRTERLKLLASYLNDKTVWDSEVDPERNEWNIAGGRFSKLEVRNFDALMLANVLLLEVEADKEWTADQWTELRERVRVALEKDLANRQK